MSFYNYQVFDVWWIENVFEELDGTTAIYAPPLHPPTHTHVALPLALSLRASTTHGSSAEHCA